MNLEEGERLQKSAAVVVGICSTVVVGLASFAAEHHRVTEHADQVAYAFWRHDLQMAELTVYPPVNPPHYTPSAESLYDAGIDIEQGGEAMSELSVVQGSEAPGSISGLGTELVRFIDLVLNDPGAIHVEYRYLVRELRHVLETTPTHWPQGPTIGFADRMSLLQNQIRVSYTHMLTETGALDDLNSAR